MRKGVAIAGLVGTLVLLSVYWLLKQAFPLMTKEKRQKHYELLNRFSQFCDHHNLTMFMEGGILLGAIRRGQMIPWDNDADVGMLSQDIPKLLEKKKLLETNYGLLLVRKTPAAFRLFLASDGVDHNAFHRKACIEIFPYRFNKTKNRIEYAHSHYRKLWPTSYFLPEEIRELRRYNFGTVRVWGPTLTEDACKRIWGPDWRVGKPKAWYQFLHPVKVSMLVHLHNFGGPK